MDFDSDATAFIRNRLSVAPVPGIPEICMYLATPTSGLHRLAAADPDFGNPYWAYRWGGGLALARYVLDHPECVAGRRVLDLGTGGGLVAIAAALKGATVTGADIDRHAVAALALNAEANGVGVTSHLGDLLDEAPPAIDLLTIGDLFYDEATAHRATAFAERCRAAGIDILVGDPYRAYLPLNRLTLLARYDVVETGSARPSAVFAFD